MSRQPRSHETLTRAAGRPVQAGDRIRATLDRVVLSGVRVPATLSRLRTRGRPHSADSLILTMDFQAPEVESQTPRSRALCREIVQEFGIRHVFDLNHGIGSHVAVEETLVGPGEVVAGCGRCLGVVGGVGTLALRESEEPLVDALVEGAIGMEVPPAVRVRVTGKVPRHIGAWDMASSVSRSLGDGFRGRVLEFTGETGEWSLDRRMGLCGLLVEMGARAALVPADAEVQAFFSERGKTIEIDPGDEDREGYESEVDLSAGDIAPVMAGTYGGAPEPMTREGGERLHDVFIGSCYGGRYEDMALTAEVLKHHGRVHPEVRLVVSPATLETARRCLHAGFYETFLEAGAMLVVPGGGPGTAAGGAIFGEGERIASTAEYHRNLVPGQGLPEVHILSPAAAVVSAVTGALTDPATSLA